MVMVTAMMMVMVTVTAMVTVMVMVMAMVIMVMFMMVVGSLRYGRFQGDGDVTTQVDWVRGCSFRAKIKVVKISMTAGLCDFVKLFVAL